MKQLRLGPGLHSKTALYLVLWEGKGANHFEQFGFFFSSLLSQKGM